MIVYYKHYSRGKLKKTKTTGIVKHLGSIFLQSTSQQMLSVVTQRPLRGKTNQRLRLRKRLNKLGPESSEEKRSLKLFRREKRLNCNALLFLRRLVCRAT